jgi:putative endonuclease
VEEKRPFIAVYIVTNKPYGTLYVGVTSNLYRRIYEHREGMVPGFTKTHGLKRLVWFQGFEFVTEAIAKEKLLKRDVRDWKINLIERYNPRWDDLYDELMRDPVWEWKHDPK